MDRDEAGDGTQAIGRTLTLLKAIAARPRAGWRSSDLASHCGFDEGTVRRILKRLTRERAVAQHAADRRYRPGPLLFELGLCVEAHREFQLACQARLEKIARAAGGVALLYLRSGDEFVCIGRAGPASAHWLALTVGTRRSLGLSAGGMAILLALPQPERDRMIAHCEQHAQRRGPAHARYFRQILARSQGYGAGVNIGDGIQGVTALAVPIRERDGIPLAALGVSGTQAKFTEEKVPALLRLLEEEARTIEQELVPPLAAALGGAG